MEKTPFSPLQPGTLVIVWNADSGWQQALLDSVHKWVSPETYSCELCRLTHGGFGPRKAWQDFVESREEPVAFMYRDTFEAASREAGLQNVELPVVLTMTSGGPTVLIPAAEVREIPDLQALLNTLKQRVP